MTKKQLIKWSAARDFLDFILVGQIPGLGTLLDLPIIIMHFHYAGPAAVVTLLEMIPVVGMIPIFTAAAMAYPNRDTPSQSQGVPQGIPADARLLPQQATPVYALVDGRLVPVILPDAPEASDGGRRIRQIESHEVSR